MNYSNSIQDAGEHLIQFDGSAYASGEYIYELNADNKFVQRRRMLLVK